MQFRYFDNLPEGSVYDFVFSQSVSQSVSQRSDLTILTKNLVL
jgi:hypothetical protein